MTENNASMSSFAETDVRRNPRRAQMPVITAASEALERRAVYAGRAAIGGVAAVSAALLMTELALTRIFSVTMYYHFAFLAISIALFGLSASGVAVYLLRRRLVSIDTGVLLAVAATAHAFATLVALACLVRIRVGLNYSAENLELMLAIYALAALPFFTGGSVMSIAFSRMTDRINVLYGADLIGAAAGCVALIPLLNWLGAPGAVMMAAGLSAIAAVAFAPVGRRRTFAVTTFGLVVIAALAQISSVAPFDLADTKGHVGDRHHEEAAGQRGSQGQAARDQHHADGQRRPGRQPPRGHRSMTLLRMAAIFLAIGHVVEEVHGPRQGAEDREGSEGGAHRRRHQLVTEDEGGEDEQVLDPLAGPERDDHRGHPAQEAGRGPGVRGG